MSTRRLIALALACGLAILVAGGIWLFMASQTEPVVSSSLGVGETADVGEVSATLLAVSPQRDGVVLEVEMQSTDVAVGDPGQGWAMISPHGLVARAEAADANDCLGRDLPARGTMRCLLTFHPTEEQATQLTIVYGRGEDRASWEFPYGEG